MSSGTRTPSPRPTWVENTPRRPTTRMAQGQSNGYYQGDDFSPRSSNRSPRYNSNGNYSTVDASRKHSSSYRPSESSPHSSEHDFPSSFTYAQASTPYGESNEDEIFEALDQNCRLPAQSRFKIHYQRRSSLLAQDFDRDDYVLGAQSAAFYNENYGWEQQNQQPQHVYQQPPHLRPPASFSHARRSSTGVPPHRPQTFRHAISRRAGVQQQQQQQQSLSAIKATNASSELDQLRNGLESLYHNLESYPQAMQTRASPAPAQQMKRGNPQMNNLNVPNPVLEGGQYRDSPNATVNSNDSHVDSNVSPHFYTQQQQNGMRSPSSKFGQPLSSQFNPQEVKLAQRELQQLLGARGFTTNTHTHVNFESGSQPRQPNRVNDTSLTPLSSTVGGITLRPLKSVPLKMAMANAQINSTISRDNTAGEGARRADLLAHFGTKLRNRATQTSEFNSQHQPSPQAMYSTSPSQSSSFSMNNANPSMFPNADAFVTNGWRINLSRRATHRKPHAS